VATRESINRVKIEGWRVSRVPIASAQAVHQGDLLVWDAANRRAIPATSASGASFLGMSDTKNPIGTAGSPEFLSDSATPRLNVIQQGLVEVIAGATETLYPFDEVVLGADAQTVVKGSSNPIGVVDPSVGSTGKAVTAGDLIKIWLRVANAYRVFY
jgi:hypothetical protein